MSTIIEFLRWYVLAREITSEKKVSDVPGGRRVFSSCNLPVRPRTSSCYSLVQKTLWKIPNTQNNQLLITSMMLYPFGTSRKGKSVGNKALLQPPQVSFQVVAFKARPRTPSRTLARNSTTPNLVKLSPNKQDKRRHHGSQSLAQYVEPVHCLNATYRRL